MDTLAATPRVGRSERFQTSDWSVVTVPVFRFGRFQNPPPLQTPPVKFIKTVNFRGVSYAIYSYLNIFEFVKIFCSLFCHEVWTLYQGIISKPYLNIENRFKEISIKIHNEYIIQFGSLTYFSNQYS